MGVSAFAAGKTMKAFVAREDGEMQARVVAFLDPDYNKRWNDRLGHLALFEARPGSYRATRELMDAAEIARRVAIDEMERHSSARATSYPAPVS